jgi:hypothetical protein
MIPKVRKLVNIHLQIRKKAEHLTVPFEHPGYMLLYFLSINFSHQGD